MVFFLIFFFFQLLSEHLNEITNEDDDALRELLDDLGEVPTVEDVVGASSNTSGISNNNVLRK